MKKLMATKSIMTRRGHREEQDHRDGHRDIRRDPEVVHGQGDPDELGDDDQEVEQQDGTDRDVPPVTAEALPDQSPVADAGHGPEPGHHFLVDDEHRYEQRQRPQQRVAEVLPGLGVGRDAPGVVVAHHDDEPRPDDGDERQEAGAHSLAVAHVV
jgi:hypothetical protein